MKKEFYIIEADYTNDKELFKINPNLNYLFFVDFDYKNKEVLYTKSIKHTRQFPNYESAYLTAMYLSHNASKGKYYILNINENNGNYNLMSKSLI